MKKGILLRVFFVDFLQCHCFVNCLINIIVVLHSSPFEITSLKVGDPLAVDSGIVTMEQMALPHHAVLTTMKTAQFKVPFCFESRYGRRGVTGTVTVLSTDDPTVATGGAATFFCTSGMMHHDECFRAVVKRRGSEFYDASGYMINTVTPVVVREEYGPVYLLVLAQGGYGKDVAFTITTKLLHPNKTALNPDEKKDEL